MQNQQTAITIPVAIDPNAIALMARALDRAHEARPQRSIHIMALRIINAAQSGITDLDTLTVIGVGDLEERLL